MKPIFLHCKKNLHESYVGIKYTHTHTLHLIMKMKYFVTSVSTWTRVSQKPMDCMIKVNQKHLLPLIPLVVGERKKKSLMAQPHISMQK